MTTIAYSEKLGTISCDTLCTHSNVKFFCDTKFYVGESFLLASAGCRAEAWRVYNLIERILQEKKYDGLIYRINSEIDWQKQNIESSYILFDRDFIKYFCLAGAVYIYAGGNFFPINQKIKSIGSGLEFATSFMALKPDEPTRSAVEFASNFDVYTAGEIKTFDLLKWEYI